ncbi:hypothetical protein KSX_52860 [Ktedonospora formicarum]|uniref:Uncharacterized protein n=1 Tax=Ktedonospora formicarum TaxID=2778364 RepID=A0A8J3I4W5_9CHLR|nr:hypothetical protein KSX_52860 [Ktedonospora formicarum]
MPDHQLLAFQKRIPDLGRRDVHPDTTIAEHHVEGDPGDALWQPGDKREGTIAQTQSTEASDQGRPDARQ